MSMHSGPTTVLATPAGPPSMQLSEQQKQMIARNRDLAIQRKQAKCLREVRQHPVSHLQSEELDEVSQEVRPPLLLTSLTSSHRCRFAFGRVTPLAARHFTTTQVAEDALCHSSMQS